MRKAKRKFLCRFIALTRVIAPFGPGLYIHPGLWIYGYNDPRSRKKK